MYTFVAPPIMNFTRGPKHYLLTCPMDAMCLFAVTKADKLCCILARDTKDAVTLFEEAGMCHDRGLHFLDGPFEIHFNTVGEILVCTKNDRCVSSLYCGRYLDDETCERHAKALLATSAVLRLQLDELSHWHGELYVVVHTVSARSSNAVGWEEQTPKLKIEDTARLQFGQPRLFCRAGQSGRFVRLIHHQNLHLIERSCTITGRKPVRFNEVVRVI